MPENEPLLLDTADTDAAPEEDVFEEPPRQRRRHPYLERLQSYLNIARQNFQEWKNIYLCALLIIALEIPLFLATAPGLQLMEDAVCYKIYGEVADRSVCQNAKVQSRLAELRGVLVVLQTFPSLLLAAPYGMLADSKGRKLVVGMTVFAALCCYTWLFTFLYFYKSLPFGLIYVYPVFLVIGGGGAVAGSIIMAIASDLVPSEESRTRAFFLLGVLGRLVSMSAPPIGARIMHYYGPYTALFLTIPTSAIPIIPLILLPETASPKKHEDSGSTHSSDPSKPTTIKMRLQELKQHIVKDFFPLLKSTTIVIGLISFMIVSFGNAIGEIIMQYMKARFGWNYEKGTNVIAFSAGLQIIFLCTILPISHKFLTNRYEAKKADLIMSKISIVFEFVAFLIFGLSPSPAGAWFAVAISCFGLGFGGALRAYLTALVPKHDLALLYTLIGTAGAIGSLFAAPLLQVTLALGIRAGGMLMGLPFFVDAFLYGLNSILVWCIRSPRIELTSDDEAPSEDGVSI